MEQELIVMQTTQANYEQGDVREIHAMIDVTYNIDHMEGPYKRRNILLVDVLFTQCS